MVISHYQLSFIFYSNQNVPLITGGCFYPKERIAFEMKSKFLFSDSIDSDAVLFLANAVHFKEAWTVAFDEVPDPVDFALSNGNVKKVKMMERISSSLATKSFTFKKVLPDVKMTLVVLPYSTANGRFEMHIVMPGKSGSLDQIMDYLTSTKEKEREAIFLTIQQAKKSIVTRNIESTLRMPFFSVKSQIGVEKYLRKLGVRAAFDEGHFNQIAKIPLRLSSVSHVASIDVTLDGTLGAAATGTKGPFSLAASDAKACGRWLNFNRDRKISISAHLQAF